MITCETSRNFAVFDQAINKMLTANKSDPVGQSSKSGVMNSNQSPSVGSVLPIAFFLAALGYGGMYFLVQYTLPTVVPRWLFFFCFVLAFTGTAMPFTAFLNRRFASQPPANASIVLRQALWVGIYASALAWLQLGRVLNVAIAVLLGIGLAIIEWLLRMRERSQWKP